MIYKFDAIKNNVHLFFLIILPPFTLMVLVLISYTRGAEHYLPPFLVNSVSIPLMISIIIAVLLGWKKKSLLWQEVTIVIDDANPTLTINGHLYHFEDMEYFEFRPGSLITTGGRPVLFMKFKGYEKLMIMPCRTSTSVDEYDVFRSDFGKKLADLKFENKKKTLSADGKSFYILTSILTPLVFIWLWIDVSLIAALKLLPALLFLASFCLITLKLYSKNK